MNNAASAGRSTPYPFDEFAPGEPLIPNERGSQRRHFYNDDGTVKINLGVLYEINTDAREAVADWFDDLDDVRKHLLALGAPCFILDPMTEARSKLGVWQSADGSIHSVPHATVTLPNGDVRSYRVATMYAISPLSGRTMRLSSLYAYGSDEGEDEESRDVMSESMRMLIDEFGGGDSGDPHQETLATQAIQVTDADEFEMLGAYLTDIERGVLQPRRVTGIVGR
jgi:hypothetical protein